MGQKKGRKKNCQKKETIIQGHNDDDKLTETNDPIIHWKNR